ncbi:MAG: hypothetical protein LBR53_05675 [Deltaproteobacteria bacterium]|nr:hypothetical protein [Deltaproteobacteria bacterium]
MNLSEVKKIAESRDIYLWGARRLGFSTLNSFTREGMTVKGFLDSSPDIQGKFIQGQPVFSPNDILSKPTDQSFIIITAGLYVSEISNACNESGFIHKKDFIAAHELQRLDYLIDVSGSCNLKCISCPRGNMRNHPEAGFMRAETFEKVLSKIIKEDPLTGAVGLYIFGEPLLNTELPEIIKICNDNGILASVSSNLNIRKSFVETIKARPAWFRVSTSGFGASYEVTHTGGKWDLFLKNLHNLRDWREEYNPDMDVEVFYHLYKDRTDDYKKMAELCGELNFTLRVCHAALMPLDNINSIITGEPLTKEARKTILLQTLKSDEAIEMAKKTKEFPCNFLRCLPITWNTKILKCSCWYDPGHILSNVDYLETPLEEIIKLRKDCDLCKMCKERAIHRYMLMYIDDNIVHERNKLT